MQLGEKKKAFKDLGNLKSKINDAPIWEEENMEVKFNKDWLKREGSQRPFSVARQLPREMSESGHSDGGAAQRDNKGPSLPICHSTRLSLLREPSQLGGRDSWLVRRMPWEMNTVLLQGLLELCI